MKRDAMYHLYGDQLSRPLRDVALSFLPESERRELLGLDQGEEPRYRPQGTVFVVTVGREDGSGPWRFVESLRAESAESAYDTVRGRHPELTGLPMRAEGPGGSFEETGP